MAKADDGLDVLAIILSGNITRWRFSNVSNDAVRARYMQYEYTAAYAVAAVYCATAYAAMYSSF